MAPIPRALNKAALVPGKSMSSSIVITRPLELLLQRRFCGNFWMPSDKPALDKLWLNLQGAKRSGLNARSCRKNGFCECREAPVIQIMQWGLSSKHSIPWRLREARSQCGFQAPPQPVTYIILWSSDIKGFRQTKVRKWEMQISDSESEKKRTCWSLSLPKIAVKQLHFMQMSYNHM